MVVLTMMVEEGSEQEELVEGLSQSENPELLEISMSQMEISMSPVEHSELLEIYFVLPEHLDRYQEFY